MTTRAVVLDVDTGVDDALAIVYAVAQPALNLLGLSCVTGNAPLPQVLTNTCAVLDVIGADAGLPVAAGADRPLVETVHGSRSHGANGLGDLMLPASKRVLDPADATEMLRRQILAAREPVTLLALAPPTNVARLLRAHPEIGERLERVVLVGGSLTGQREFNLSQDPEAADVVLRAGVPVTVYPLEIFSQVALPEATAIELTGHRQPAVRLAGQLLHRRRSREGADRYAGLIGDAGALVLLTHPQYFTVRECTVSVGLRGRQRGRLRVLLDERAAPPFPATADLPHTAQIATAVDGDAVVQAFRDALGT